MGVCIHVSGSMGFDVEVFVELPSSDLICPVCHKVFDNPVVVWENCPGFYCCRGCINKTPQGLCLKCRLPTSNHNTQAEQECTEFIGSMSVKCSFLKFGCQDAVKLKDLRSHEQICQFRAFPCPNPHCEYSIQQIPHQILQKHLDQCEWRLLVCENCGAHVPRPGFNAHFFECQKNFYKCECGEVVNPKDLETHKQGCNFTVIECDIPGCSFRAQRCDTDKWLYHESEFTHHRVLLKKSLQDLKSQIQQEQARTASVQQQAQFQVNRIMEEIHVSRLECKTLKQRYDEQQVVMLARENELKMLGKQWVSHIQKCPLLQLQDIPSQPSPAITPQLSFLWEFLGFKEAIKLKQNQFSPEFTFTSSNSQHCYSFQICIALWGPDILIYYIARRGPSPNSLEWPMKKRVRLTVANFKTNVQLEHVVGQENDRDYFAKHSPPAVDNNAVCSSIRVLGDCIDEYVDNDRMLIGIELID
eukprot:c10074_g1_i2.p1 GENE.c10074_g1_i2~~c10074_g1_i2.p1  ORF type:complete len:472 (+),score=76.04 c10074_g1_i2:2-1417(+)